MQGLKKFLEQYHVKKFSKGEIALYEGETPTCVYVIKSGVIKTYNLTSEGSEKPISFDTEPEAFPVGWAFSKLRHSQYYYEAFTDCELYCVPREDYVDFLKNNPDVLYEAYDHLLKRYLNSQMRVYALEQSKAADKVLNTLHFLCLRFGEDVKENMVKITLPLTQQDLANFIGLTRETTGIELKKLERAGVIEYNRQNYVIHTDKLDELIDEEYSAGRFIDEVETMLQTKIER